MMKGMKLSPDDGGSGGGGGDPAGNGDNGSGGAEDKTFTQEQVNSMIAAEKRKNLSSVYKGLGFDSEEAAKAFVDKYKGEEEKNKTDLYEKLSEILRNSEILSKMQQKAFENARPDAVKQITKNIVDFLNG